ncbi:MAG: hypothetical protein QOJ89_1092 [bacterium]|jgi:RNA polymerase sigma-70 factor (ECF subfamily)
MKARAGLPLSRDPFADPAPLIRRVYAYVAYRIGAGAEAEDVTSETFARALRYRDSYDAAKGTPISWLIGIARRCIDESLRQPRPTGDPPELPCSRDLAADAAERLTIMAAFDVLGERDRELLALRYGADLSARQIARTLDLTTNAVDVALHRARSRLRIALDGEPARRRPPAPAPIRPVRKPVPTAVGDVRARDEGVKTDAIVAPQQRP